jgi:hypothetical protein
MAAERLSRDEPKLVLHEGESLVSVMSRGDDGFVEQIFRVAIDADATVDDNVIRTALSLAGAWSDLDWDEMAEALDCIRHSNPPSPPLTR